MAPHVLLAAGGTGGHVFPAEALAAELMARGYRLGLVTDKRGEAYGGTLGALETHHILAGGLAGKSPAARIKSVVKLGVGTYQAWRLLKRLDPDVVVGFGGYASVPTMVAASFSATPAILHEQNALLGRANRMLSARVDAIATSFAETRGIPRAARSKVELTGMPVRANIISQAGVAYPRHQDGGRLCVLILGGSQGASVLSEVVPRALAKLPASLRTRLDVVQQCREADLDDVRTLYGDSHIRAHLAGFIEDVPQRLAQAHLVIARAGASSVAEVLAVGRPAIWVPYPFAADDHQTCNAQALDAAGAGWIMPQETFDAVSLAARLEALFGFPSVLEKAARCAHNLGRTDAARRLADVVARFCEDKQVCEDKQGKSS